MILKHSLFLALLTSSLSMTALAAEIDIDFVDAAGLGFYDTAVVTPIDGNGGVSVSEYDAPIKINK